jgi:hypothetical protein
MCSKRQLTVFLLSLSIHSFLILGPFLFSLAPPPELELGKRKEVFRHVPICIVTESMPGQHKHSVQFHRKAIVFTLSLKYYVLF